MATTAHTATIPLRRRARTRRELSFSGRVARPLPLPAPAREEGLRGWYESHFRQVVAFLLSAIAGAAVASSVLQPLTASSVVSSPEVAAPSTPDLAVATTRTEPEVAMPAPVVAPVPTQSVPSSAVMQGHGSKHASKHQRARSHRGHASVSAVIHVSAAVRSAYAHGDLGAAERLLRKAGHADQANLVASMRSYLASAEGELREHDELAATRSFETVARGHRAVGLGPSVIARDVGRQLSLLHLAAGLRARRVGDDTQAVKELAAAVRADPSNRRASLELGVTGGGRANAFIDPE